MNRRRHNAGFSLIEIMVAILILGVALAGFTRGITTALSSNKESELQTAASLVAAGQVETLRASKDIIDGVTEGDCGDDLPLYQWTQTISPSDLDGLHEVKVVVQKVDSSLPIYELATLVFDPDYPGQDENAGLAEHQRAIKRGKARGAE
jgi:prepilin-type N-terminal cleavage/methylation domain-containing protein